MIFPILIVKKGSSPLYFFRENSFGLVSKGGEKFYKYGTVYDCEGNIFSIAGIESIKKTAFLKSVRYFQPMYQVQIKYKKIDSASLEEFKQVMIDHIYSHKKYWSSRDTFENLKNSIAVKENFHDIITFLK